LRNPTLKPGRLGSERVTKSDGIRAWIQDTHWRCKQLAPVAVSWQVEEWLLNRPWRFQLLSSENLRSAIYDPASSWPPNLRFGLQLNPGLEFPGKDLPVSVPGEEEWRFFPLQKKQHEYYSYR